MTYFFLLIERFANIGMYLVVPNTVELLMTGLILLTIIMISAFVFTLISPYYIETISAYFSVQAVYIIKNNGQMIYKFNFQDIKQEPVDSTELLLGGFIYALTTGLKDVLKMGSSIHSISFGELNLLFKNGKYVFGVLMVKQYVPMIIEKLNYLVDDFEDKFKDFLEHWTGSVDVFDSQIIHEMILGLFK